LSKTRNRVDVAMTVERTALGQRALVERTGPLSQRQRSVLFLVDGKRDLDGLAHLATAAGVSRSDLDSLFTLGLLRSAPPPRLYRQVLAERCRKAETEPLVTLAERFSLQNPRLAGVDRSRSDSRMPIPWPAG
jgi:hypothetical protein